MRLRGCIGAAALDMADYWAVASLLVGPTPRA